MLVAQQVGDKATKRDIEPGKNLAFLYANRSGRRYRVENNRRRWDPKESQSSQVRKWQTGGPEVLARVLHSENSGSSDACEYGMDYVSCLRAVQRSRKAGFDTLGNEICFEAPAQPTWTDVSCGTPFRSLRYQPALLIFLC